MKLKREIIGFIGGLLLWPVLAGAATHTVNQVGLTFDPAVIEIEIGDTVNWIWSQGSHTVTSGTNLADPEVGLLFDTALNSANNTVSYTFTELGSQDYFCRPHLSFGMTGSVNVVAPSGVDEVPVRGNVRLLANTPNPFNPSTSITFGLPTDRTGPMAVNLQIFDLQGRLVKTLLDRELDADQHTVRWSGESRRGEPSPSGVYIYRLVAGGQVLSRTMTLAK